MKQDRKSKLAESRSMVSPVYDGDGGFSDAPRVGADLRAARYRLGWELPEVAAGLRIRLPYLEALEDGRIGDLPGNAYALGFLRTYATALGLDADELARRFKAEAALVTNKTKLQFPVPVPERGVPAGAIVLLGAVLAVGAYIGWYRLSGEGKLPAETVTPVPARLAPLAEQAVPPMPPTPAPAAATPATATATAAVPAAPPSAAPPPATPAATANVATTVSPASASAAVPPPHTGPVAAVPVTTVSAQAGAPTGPSSPDGTRIMLRARADAWVQVRDRSGQVLLNRVLHAGDTWSVPSRPNLLLTTGNAGATDLVVDGVVSAPLGANGVVRRDLPLDPDQIKDGKLAVATPASQPAPAIRQVAQ